MLSELESKRRAFLIGEGTLTAGEVMDWAMEMQPSPVPIPVHINEDTKLMVTVDDHDLDGDWAGAST